MAAAAERGGTERQELRTQAGTSGVQVGVKSTKIYIHIYDRRGEWVSGVLYMFAEFLHFKIREN